METRERRDVEPAAEMERLQRRLQPLLTELEEHPLYRSMHRLEDLHRFMETHVFAVWDFMCLLKALQRGLTCVEVPWVPSRTPEARRLINEIVLGEESDVYEGEALSHLELYLRAMQQCGASTAAIDEMLARLRQGSSVRAVLAEGRVPPAARRFVESTFGFLENGALHVVAAAFTFGREDLIPSVFTAFLRDQNEKLSGGLALFRWYLDRHIEVDGEEHGPMALRMISELCGRDEQRWAEAEEAAVAALTARLRLWDGILAELQGTPIR